MANKYRGEVPFPQAGKGAYIRFELADIADLEDAFGESFFETIEKACSQNSVKGITKILEIGLKVRDGSEERRIWSELDHKAMLEKGFKIGEADRPIMEALSWSWLQKSYETLIAEAIEAKKKADAEAVQYAKGVAEEAGVPFDEALSSGLLKFLTGLNSAPSTSGA